MNRFLVAITLLVLLTGRARGWQQTDQPAPNDPSAARWIDQIAAEVPPLKHPRGDRLPMIVWEGAGFGELSDADRKVLGDRGLCQHFQLSDSMIPAALAAQAAGMPVILMEGRTDNWPYSLESDVSKWAHQLPTGFPRPWFGDENAFGWHGACPNQTSGWKTLYEQTHKTLTAFRSAGVNVVGVWVDFEGDPYPWSHLYDQARVCKRCQAELPAGVLKDRDRFRDYSWQQYVRLYDQHFAKAVRDVFPECFVTNWHVVRSTNARPVRYFVRDTLLPELKFDFFNATNPIAYGTDSVWINRATSIDKDDQVAVDRFYFHELLQQVSTDHANHAGKHMSIPWVARVCRLQTEPGQTPTMSREAYREGLRHLWLRGVDSMQLFNARTTGDTNSSIREVADAVVVFDEMHVVFGDDFSAAVPINLDVPDARSGEVIWSAMRSGDRAIVRITRNGSDQETIDLELWPGQIDSLDIPPTSETFVVTR